MQCIGGASELVDFGTTIHNEHNIFSAVLVMNTVVLGEVPKAYGVPYVAC